MTLYQTDQTDHTHIHIISSTIDNDRVRANVSGCFFLLESYLAISWMINQLTQNGQEDHVREEAGWASSRLGVTIPLFVIESGKTSPNSPLIEHYTSSIRAPPPTYNERTTMPTSPTSTLTSRRKLSILIALLVSFLTGFILALSSTDQIRITYVLIPI